MGDKQLRQDILDELDFEPSINATNIGVAVENGVVTLSGHVASYSEKLAADRAVQRIRGVRAIADEIEVRYPGGKKTADDEIAKRALDILHWSATPQADALRITVRDGWVTLAGQVDWHYQKAAVENAVRKLSGVAGIMNNIAIRATAQPADVKSKIEDAFRRSAQIDAKHVHVSVEAGKVRLEGHVRAWHERDTAEDAEWAIPGVTAVENRLSIT